MHILKFNPSVCLPESSLPRNAKMDFPTLTLKFEQKVVKLDSINHPYPKNLKFISLNYQSFDCIFNIEYLAPTDNFECEY